MNLWDLRWNGTLATSAARYSARGFSLGVMVFNESLGLALERDIGHESRPVGWGFGNIVCEFQFSADLMVPCRNVDTKKLGAFNIRLRKRFFCRSYGALQKRGCEKT